MSRESRYLTRKIEAFDMAFKFFSVKSGEINATEKMLIFLSNINFWDWEMENLIYSIINFEDRSKSFESYDDVLSKIMKNGFLIKKSKIEDLKRDRRWKNKSKHFANKSKVAAPIDKMNEVIDDWNEFLLRIEGKIMSQTAKSFDDLGDNIKSDLSDFKQKKIGE